MGLMTLRAGREIDECVCTSRERERERGGHRRVEDVVVERNISCKGAILVLNGVH